MSISGGAPESKHSSMKAARTAARNKMKVHPEPQAAEVKKLLPFHFARRADEETTHKNFDLALDEKDPQAALLSRAFDHVTVKPELMAPIVEFCKTFEKEAKHFRNSSSEKYVTDLTANADKSVFDDEGNLQVWVLATILDGVNDKEELLSTFIKEHVFKPIQTIIFDQEGHINKQLYEFYSRRLNKRDSRVEEAIKQHDELFVGKCFVSAIASVYCTEISKLLSQNVSSLNMAMVFVDIIKHQIKTNSKFVNLCLEINRLYNDHAKFADSIEFKQFIRSIEKDCFKKLPNVDMGKYIPLLELAKNIMQLPQVSLVYDFAVTELLAMVKQFEAIRTNSSDQSIEKCNHFNEMQVKPLLGHVKLMIPETYKEAKKVSFLNAEMLFDYHLNKIKNSESTLKQTHPQLFTAINNAIETFLKIGRSGSIDRKHVDFELDWLSDIRRILGQQSLSTELQREMLTYLLGPRDENLDKIIKNILDNTYKNPIDYLELFSLFNAITNKEKSSEYRDKSHAILSRLAQLHTPGECTFSKTCAELHKFYVRLTDQKEEKHDAVEEKTSVASCHKMFLLYANIIEHANNELLKDVVEQVKIIAEKPNSSFIQPMENISLALYYLSLIGKNCDQGGVMNDSVVAAYRQAVIRIESINKASEFRAAVNCLKKALLICQMKHDKDHVLINQLLGLDPLKTDFSCYHSTYTKMQKLKARIDNRDANKILSLAATAVYQDARVEYTNNLAEKASAVALNLGAILQTVNDIMGPEPKMQDVKILTSLISAIPAPVLSAERKIVSSLLIFAGIAALVVGFVLSPFTAFTSAYLGYQAAAACMAAGALVAGGTGVSVWNAKRPTGIAKSLGGFIRAVSQSEMKLEPAPVTQSRSVFSELN